MITPGGAERNGAPHTREIAPDGEHAVTRNVHHTRKGRTVACNGMLKHARAALRALPRCTIIRDSLVTPVGERRSGVRRGMAPLGPTFSSPHSAPLHKGPEHVRSLQSAGKARFGCAPPRLLAGHHKSAGGVTSWILSVISWICDIIVLLM